MNLNFLFSIVLLIILIHPNYAQIPTEYLISPMGGNFSNGTYSVDWAFGEIGITTLSNDEFAITQGYEQPTVRRIDNNCFSQAKENIPTAFSPYSNIPVNQFFDPLEEFIANDCPLPQKEAIEFVIFNRWKEIIFKSKGYQPWNGLKDNRTDKVMPRATYYYFLKIPQPVPLPAQVFKGPINLLY